MEYDEAKSPPYSSFLRFFWMIPLSDREEVMFLASLKVKPLRELLGDGIAVAIFHAGRGFPSLSWIRVKVATSDIVKHIFSISLLSWINIFGKEKGAIEVIPL